MLYIYRNGEQLGPYSEANVENFLKNGTLDYTDLIWKEGWTDWKSVEDVFPRVNHNLSVSLTPPAVPPLEPRQARSITKSKWGKIAIYALAIAGVFYLASPYLATYQLINALKSGDSTTLKKRIDFPELRESLKDQFKTYMIQQAKESLSKAKDDPMDAFGAGIAAAIGPALIDGMVDNFVTPSGLAGLIADPKNAASGRSPESGLKIPAVTWAFFSGPTEFKITNREGSTLHLKLQNFRWMLYAITFPQDGISMVNSSSSNLEQSENKQTSNVGKPYVGYWAATGIPDLVISLSEDGILRDGQNSGEQSYSIDSQGQLTVKSGDKTTLFSLSQPSAEDIVLSDPTGKKMEFKRITEREFQSSLIRNSVEQFMSKARAFFLAVQTASLDSVMAGSSSLYPADVRAQSLSEYLRKLVQIGAIKQHEAEFVAKNFSIANVSQNDDLSTYFLISRSDSAELPSGAIVTVDKGSEMKVLQNQSLDNTKLPRRSPHTLAD